MNYYAIVSNDEFSFLITRRLHPLVSLFNLHAWVQVPCMLFSELLTQGVHAVSLWEKPLVVKILLPNNNVALAHCVPFLKLKLWQIPSYTRSSGKVQHTFAFTRSRYISIVFLCCSCCCNINTACKIAFHIAD